MQDIPYVCRNADYGKHIQIDRGVYALPTRCHPTFFPNHMPILVLLVRVASHLCHDFTSECTSRFVVFLVM